jgi:hypothetical protein
MGKYALGNPIWLKNGGGNFNHGSVLRSEAIAEAGVAGTAEGG